jgi:hypothetical protein
LFADYSISVDGKLCLFSSYQVEYWAKLLLIHDNSLCSQIY